MKKQCEIMGMVLCLLVLAGCTDSGKLAMHPDAMQQANQMQRLQMLVNQALQTAAHGANMKLAGENKRGQAMLTEAISLLRRAMSGPEMTMMHKGGQKMPANMKQTHAIGDAAFDLIGLMMALSENAVQATQLRQLNEQLAVAAAGNAMLLQAKSAGNLEAVMQEHGRTLLDLAGQPLTEPQNAGAYHKLVGKLLTLLAAGRHHTPDKR